MKGPDFIFRAVKKDLPDRALVGFCFLEPLPVGINEVNPSLSLFPPKECYLNSEFIIKYVELFKNTSGTK